MKHKLSHNEYWTWKTMKLNHWILYELNQIGIRFHNDRKMAQVKVTQIAYLVQSHSEIEKYCKVSYLEWWRPLWNLSTEFLLDKEPFSH